MSYAYQNQTLSALKLFYGEVNKTKLYIEKLNRPRREHRLPNVLGRVREKIFGSQFKGSI
jgi:hypothetical protein